MQFFSGDLIQQRNDIDGEAREIEIGGRIGLRQTLPDGHHLSLRLAYGGVRFQPSYYAPSTRLGAETLDTLHLPAPVNRSRFPKLSLFVREIETRRHYSDNA